MTGAPCPCGQTKAIGNGPRVLGLDQLGAGTTERYIAQIADTDEVFDCFNGEDLLTAMRRSQCRSIPVGCCNGGCGACRIRILSGSYTTRKMSRGVISADEERSHYVLACRTYPLADISLEVVGRKWEMDGNGQTKE
nr:2Fe-2S iron-sulfur cluster-binding protein [Thiohalocapsa marina]